MHVEVKSKFSQFAVLEMPLADARQFHNLLYKAVSHPNAQRPEMRSEREFLQRMCDAFTAGGVQLEKK